MKKALIIAALSIITFLTGCDNSTPPPSPTDQLSQKTQPVTDLAEGKYTSLKSPLPSEELTNKRPYLVEFFWFGCPHCYSLEPLAKAFKQNNPDFEYIMMPAAPNDRWEIEARLFYAMEALGVKETHFDEIFKLYADKRTEKRYPTLDELVSVMSSSGITKESLAENMQSEEVNLQIARTKRLFDQAELTGVPALVINGKYQLEFSKLDSNNFANDFMQTIIALGKK
ncbi:MAG: thiol:disulfide interchange protein DsbA/DsbL [Sedimenticola sp.]|nr:thiol:disulfide interchange protein DsbA/DsbL [Sedimenticola sp.]